MATPDPIVGPNVPLSYSTFTHFLHAGLKVGSIKCVWGVIRYHSGAWEVHASYDSNELTSGALAWGANGLTITLPPGYGFWPVVQATPIGETAPHVRPEMLSPTSLDVRFLNASLAPITTESETMQFSLFLIGV